MKSIYITFPISISYHYAWDAPADLPSRLSLRQGRGIGGLNHWSNGEILQLSIQPFTVNLYTKIASLSVVFFSCFHLTIPSPLCVLTPRTHQKSAGFKGVYMENPMDFPQMIRPAIYENFFFSCLRGYGIFSLPETNSKRTWK